MCFIFRRTGDRSDKSLLPQVKAPLFTYKTCAATLGFSEIEPEMEISHAYKAALPE